MIKYLKFYLGFLTTLILLLLVCNTFSFLKVDTNSIFLVLMLIAIPFLTLVKKLKWGELEAEITREEVKQLKEEVAETNIQQPVIEEFKEKLKPIIIEKYTNEEVSGLKDYLLEMVETDPILALAKLRIELERLVRIMYNIYFKDELKPKPIGYMIHALKRKVEYIQLSKATSIQYLENAERVAQFCSRALHGEKIEAKDAKTIIEIGNDVISFFTGYAYPLKQQGKI